MPADTPALASSARISRSVMSDFCSTRRRISAACASICAERRSPPSGPGATDPASRTSAAQRTALAALTPKRTAAARQDDPAATAATTRSRKSTDSALDMPIAPMFFAEQQTAWSERVSDVQVDAFTRVRLEDVTVNE